MNDHKLSDDKAFEEWFKQYANCPRCQMETSMRLAASNAWYTQQYKIDQLQAELAEAKAQLKACQEIQKTLLRRISFLEALTDTKEG